jgi:ribosomal protein S6E (S10)
MDSHQTTQKKYNMLTHQEKKLPLWTSITAINDELKKFCSKHDRVYFFDGTEIFAEQDGKYWNLQLDMISVRGHPTKKGFEKWEGLVVQRAKKILAESDPYYNY